MKNFRHQDGCWNCRFNYELFLDQHECQHGVKPQRDKQKDWEWMNRGLKGFLDSQKPVDKHLKKCQSVEGYGICDNWETR